MDRYPMILLANEPGSYRSLLATELPFLRPNLRVLEVHPTELDEAVSIHRPAVVICSRQLAPLDGLEVAMLILYPQGDDTCLQLFRGSNKAIHQPRLSDILDAIDHIVASPHS